MMKKQIAIFLSLITLVSFVSCEEHQSDETTAETTAEEVFAEEKNDIAYYPSPDPFSETPTRLLYVNSGVIYYYNKLTEENYIFCFDSLCQHGGFRECIAHKFLMAGTRAQSIEYCAVDNRFYALRGEQFCSFSFDGSDLQVVASFGEVGNFDQMAYLYGALCDLRVQGKYIYFLAIDSESGKRILMCYNTESQALKRLFYDPQTTVYGYQIGNDSLYLSLVGEYSGLYRFDLDGENLQQISEDIYESFGEGIFDGENVYFIETTEQYDPDRQYYRYVPKKIISYSLINNTFEEVMTITDTRDHQLLAVKGNDIYFTIMENTPIGYYVHSMGKDEYVNQYSKIYRYNKESGEVTIVLNDIRCDTSALYFIEDKVLLTGHVCTPDQERAWRTEGAFIAKLDEEGLFTDLIPLNK